MSAQLNELGFMGYVGERFRPGLGGPLTTPTCADRPVRGDPLHVVSQTSQVLALFGVSSTSARAAACRCR
jgi:hypothetical protein